MDSVELILIAGGAGIVLLAILIAIVWRPFSSLKPSDEFHESGIGSD